MVSTSFSVYILTHLPFFRSHSVTHDALRTTLHAFRNSTAVQARSTTPQSIHQHHKIVTTRRRNSEHRCARLCMAAGRPMAGKSGYSKYTHDVQKITLNLRVKEVSIVHTHCQGFKDHRRPLMVGCFLRTQKKPVLREYRTLMAG